MTMLTKSSLTVAAVLTCSSAVTPAAEWSDTSLSWRIGNRFGEPFNPLPIRKNIVALTHASGYQYGTNFFNIDLLQSDRNDPGSLTQRSGAQEAYVMYRHTFDIGKLRGQVTRFAGQDQRRVGQKLGFDAGEGRSVGIGRELASLMGAPAGRGPVVDGRHGGPFAPLRGGFQVYFMRTSSSDMVG